MNFLSVAFLLFFVVVLVVYRLVPPRTGVWPIALGSLAFYAWWDLRHLGLLVGLSVSVYVLALGMDRAKGSVRHAFFFGAIGVVVGGLVAARTGTSAIGGMVAVFGDPVSGSVSSSSPLPVLGLAFFSLRLIAYLIEVHRRRWKAELHFARFIAYVSFFPELPAGPIERPQDLLPQLSVRTPFDYSGLTFGLKLVTWGIFKKVVVADRLAIIVNTVYGSPADYGSLSLLIATVFFAFQLYCDFSGYSDIAIGAGQILGFKLRQNFDLPYLSASVSEFWNRWHMSLTSWLRDYIFLPLAFAVGRLLDKFRLSQRNIDALSYSIAVFATVILAGLWHGFTWTFVLWGAVNGFFIVAGRLRARRRHRTTRLGMERRSHAARFVRVILTFAAVNLGWIFFRAETPRQAMAVLWGVLTKWQWLKQPPALIRELGALGVSRPVLALACAWLALVAVSDLVAYLKGKDVVSLVSGMRPVARWAIYYGMILGILLFATFEATPFIYFHF